MINVAVKPIFSYKNTPIKGPTIPLIPVKDRCNDWYVPASDGLQKYAEPMFQSNVMVAAKIP